MCEFNKIQLQLTREQVEEISEQVEEISDIITIPTIQHDKIEEKNDLLVEKLLEEQEKK